MEKILIIRGAELLGFALDSYLLKNKNDKFELFQNILFSKQKWELESGLIKTYDWFQAQIQHFR